MIYVHDNAIFYYGDYDHHRKIEMVGEQLVCWRAKLGNKYWKKELMENVKRKIELFTHELEMLKELR